MQVCQAMRPAPGDIHQEVCSKGQEMRPSLRVVRCLEEHLRRTEALLRQGVSCLFSEPAGKEDYVRSATQAGSTEARRDVRRQAQVLPLGPDRLRGQVQRDAGRQEGQVQGDVQLSRQVRFQGLLEGILPMQTGTPIAPCRQVGPVRACSFVF